jgi:hypothetical protein
MPESSELGILTSARISSRCSIPTSMPTGGESIIVERGGAEKVEKDLIRLKLERGVIVGTFAARAGVDFAAQNEASIVVQPLAPSCIGCCLFQFFFFSGRSNGPSYYLDGFISEYYTFQITWRTPSKRSKSFIMQVVSWRPGNNCISRRRWTEQVRGLRRPLVEREFHHRDYFSLFV